jgi:type VI secretion system VasD/TssJ family lipoprotein
LHSQTLTLRPGEQRLIELQLDSAARALAAVAEFRDPNNSTWRTSVALTSAAMEKKGPVRVSLRVDSMQVQMNLGD